MSVLFDHMHQRALLEFDQMVEESEVFIRECLRMNGHSEAAIIRALENCRDSLAEQRENLAVLVEDALSAQGLPTRGEAQ